MDPHPIEQAPKDEGGSRCVLICGLYCLVSIRREIERGQDDTNLLEDLVEILEVLHGWWRGGHLSLTTREREFFDRLNTLPLDGEAFYRGEAALKAYVRTPQFRDILETATEMFVTMLEGGIDGVENGAHTTVCSLTAAWQSAG